VKYRTLGPVRSCSMKPPAILLYAYSEVSRTVHRVLPRVHGEDRIVSGRMIPSRHTEINTLLLIVPFTTILDTTVEDPNRNTTSGEGPTKPNLRRRDTSVSAARCMSSAGTSRPSDHHPHQPDHFAPPPTDQRDQAINLKHARNRIDASADSESSAVEQQVVGRPCAQPPSKPPQHQPLVGRPS
jgi:hypothetical protein